MCRTRIEQNFSFFIVDKKRTFHYILCGVSVYLGDCINSLLVVASIVVVVAGVHKVGTGA